MTYSLFALISPIVLGFIILSLIWPHRIFHQFFLKLILGAGAGIGISSCIFFFDHLLFPADRFGSGVIEILLILLLLPILVRRKWEPFPVCFSQPWKIRNRPIIIIFLGIPLILIIFFSVYSFIRFSYANPHGYYDAFSIWNLHARMIFRGGANWTAGFSPSLYHADYPLLLPSSIARIWTLIGRETIRTPMLIAGFYTYSTVALLFFSLSNFKNNLSATLAAMLLLSTAAYMITGSSQYADIPLSFYILATGFCLFLFQSTQKKNYLFLSSLFSGLSAWTKNEGILFFLIISAITLWLIIKNNKSSLQLHLLIFISGFFFPIFSLVLFKFNLAPKNDLFIDQNLSIIIKNLISPDRYFLIIKNLIMWAADTWQITSLVAIMVFSMVFGVSKIERPQKTGIILLLIAVGALLAGYCGIYLITPWDLVVHMRTSSSRLLLHIYPLLLFITFMVINTPNELLANTSTKDN